MAESQRNMETFNQSPLKNKKTSSDGEIHQSVTSEEQRRMRKTLSLEEKLSALAHDAIDCHDIRVVSSDLSPVEVVGDDVMLTPESDVPLDSPPTMANTIFYRPRPPKLDRPQSYSGEPDPAEEVPERPRSYAGEINNLSLADEIQLSIEREIMEAKQPRVKQKVRPPTSDSSSPATPPAGKDSSSSSVRERPRSNDNISITDVGFYLPPPPRKKRATENNGTVTPTERTRLLPVKTEQDQRASGTMRPATMGGNDPMTPAKPIPPPIEIPQPGQLPIPAKIPANRKCVMIAEPSTYRTMTFDADYEYEELPVSPRSPRSPLESSDEAYYDTVSSTCSTASLLRKAAMERYLLREGFKEDDCRSEDCISYDTVSSTSSTAVLLRKAAAKHRKDTEEAAQLPAEEMTDGDYVDMVHSSKVGPVLGQALLARTLDQVKRSLEDMTPTFIREEDRKNIAKAKATYLKNLVVLSVGFMLPFTAFFSLRNLQSSINHEKGLGFVTMGAMYAAFIAGCIFATSIVQKIRPKYSMVASIFGLILFFAANFYPAAYTMAPTAAIAGFAMAILWTAQGTYITSIAVSYAAAAEMNYVGILGLFNGFFLFLISVAQIFGNLISSTVFNIQLAFDEGNKVHIANYSEMMSTLTEPSLNICGSNYCHAYRIEHSSVGVQEHLVYILLGIFCGLTGLGMLILGIWLNKLDIIFCRKSQTSIVKQLLALFELHRNKKLLCLLPLLIYIGMQEAYLFGEFTKAFITCPMGLQTIGYAMMCYGSCDALSSVFFGHMQKYVHRNVLISIAAVLHASLLVAMYLWKLGPEDYTIYIVFIMTGLWGIADGIWQTQSCSLCGILFTTKKEAAFASLRMYEALGFVIAFTYAQFLCLDIKLCIMGSVLTSGMIGYFIMDRLHRREYTKNAVVTYV